MRLSADPPRADEPDAPPPVVSVIVPAYNTAPYVAETLDSIFAQTFTAYEVVVVNDGSPDTPLLEQALEPYAGRIRYLRQENAGVSVARNNALAVARGRYVAMLDSDDLWHPEYLASQVAVLDADPAVDVVYPDAVRFGAGITEERYSDQFPVGGEITFLRVLSRDCQVYGGVTARRNTILEAGGYDPALRSAEDLDLWLRILRRGGRIVFNDQVLAYYRYRAGSHTVSTQPLLRNVMRLLEKVTRTMDLAPEERAVVDRDLKRARADLALTEGRDALRAGDLRTALARLSESKALTERPNRKLSLAIAVLRVFPWPLRAIFLLRERVERKRAARGAAP